MHFCTAMISIGDDKDNVFFADMFDPVSWPEIQIIQFIHGDNAVDQIRPFVSVAQTAREERQRLAEKYGEAKVADVFPRSGPGEMEAPEATIAYGQQWKDPRTRHLETIEDEAPKDPTTGRFTGNKKAA
jgi:hypothetical protein